MLFSRSLQMGGPIDKKDTLRNLGVMVSTDHTYSVQIAMAMTVASMIGQALRIIRGREKHLMQTIFHTLTVISVASFSLHVTSCPSTSGRTSRNSFLLR